MNIIRKDIERLFKEHSLSYSFGYESVTGRCKLENRKI